MYKTITLGGTEQEVKLAGQNCDIRNDGAETVYISAKPNIVAGEDGVLSVPVGQAAKLLDCRGTVYLLGTGTVLLCGNDYSELVFKCAATSSGEGGTQDDVARTMASANTANIAQMKPITDSVSNDNLLINPDLKINQRGITTLTTGNAHAYCVDGWFTARSVVEVTDNGILLAWDDVNNVAGYIQQKIERSDLFGKEVAVSVEIDGEWVHLAMTAPETAGTTVYETVSNNIEIGLANWSGEYLSVTILTKSTTPSLISAAKAEAGTAVTPFYVPEPATELAKCQRYLLDLFQYSAYRAVSINENYIDFSLPTPTTMRPLSGISIVNPENFEMRLINSAVAQAGFSYSVSNYGRNQLRLRATKTSHGLTDATLTVSGGKSVLLSAEL